MHYSQALLQYQLGLIITMDTLGPTRQTDEL